MTNHYTIQITATDTHFKATYRDGKFRKLEHLRGALDDAMLRQLGRIIPRTEDRYAEFATAYEGKVTYTKEVAQKSEYTQFVEAWYVFYENFRGITPKFTGMDGKSLKQIIAYLKNIGHSESEALALWHIILDKWTTLNDFHKENTDLKYINSKLNIILHAIKQQNNTVASSANGSIEL